MNDIEELLASYQVAVMEIRRALKEAGLSEREATWKTVTLPDFSQMLPEDVINFYKDIKVEIVLYLSKLGLSTREIEKRLKGDSYGSVQTIIENHRTPSDRATTEEVSKNV